MGKTLSPDLESISTPAELGWICRTRPVLRGCMWAALLTSVLVIYVAVATGGSFIFRSNLNNYYDRFAESLLAGHLHFLVEPPAELLALPNPYDWKSREDLMRSGILDGSNYVHDATLFGGKYYLTSAPAPSLLHVAWRLVGGGLADSAATVVFGFAGVLGFALLVHQIRSREFPDTPEWLGVLLVLTYALGGASLLVQGRGQTYGESVAATACFVIWGLFFWWWGAHGESGSTLKFALAGLLFGCAFMSRLSALGYLLASPVFATIVCLQRNGKGRSNVIRTLVVIWMSALALIILQLAYNAARFGSPFELGSKWVLVAGDVSNRSDTGTSTAFLMQNISAYFLSPVTIIRGFPYIAYRDSSLTVIEGVSYAFEGPFAPVYLLSPMSFLAPLAILPMLARLRRPISPLTLFLCVASAGALFSMAILLTVGSAASRYLQDFVPASLLVAGVGIFCIYRRPPWQVLRRRLIGVTIWLLAAVSIVGGSTLLLNFWAAGVRDATGSPSSVQFARLAYAADCATQMVASRLDPDSWAADYLAVAPRRWNAIFVPHDADIQLRGPAGAPIWGIEVTSRLADPRKVIVEANGQVVSVTELRPGSQTLRFQEETRLDSRGIGVIRLKSEEPVGACGRLLWDAWLGPPRIGTVEDRSAVDRWIEATLRIPEDVPASVEGQRHVIAEMHRVYSAALSSLAWDNKIARRAAELEREQTERLAARVRELQASDPSGRRNEATIREEVARVQEVIRALQLEHDHLQAELTTVRGTVASSSTSTAFPSDRSRFTPSRTQEEWQTQIETVRRSYDVRLDESVSDVASMRAESSWLRTVPSQEYKQRILQLEAAEGREQRDASELTWNLYQHYETRNALQLEIEQQQASLNLAKLRFAP